MTSVSPDPSVVPLISVCILTYNHEKYISEAILSVIEQRTRFNLELVIFDDSSTDNTYQIVKDTTASTAIPLTLQSNATNLGMMANSELAYNACTGDYIAFLEGDDRWTSSEKLETQVTIMEANKTLSMCAHRVNLIDKNSNVLTTRPATAAGIVPHKLIFEKSLFQACSVVYRRRMIPTLPKWITTCQLGDWPLNMSYAECGPVFLCDDIMADYRIHDQGTWSTQKWTSRCSKTIKMLRTAANNLKPENTPLIRKTLVKHESLLFGAHCITGNFKQAISLLRQ